MGQFSKNYRTFTQKIVIELPKVWVWDPGSGKTYSDPGSRIQGSKRHRILDPDPQHCLIVLNTVYCTRLKKWCRTLIRSLRYLQYEAIPRFFEIPLFTKAPDPGSGSATLPHCFKYDILYLLFCKKKNDRIQVWI